MRALSPPEIIATLAAFRGRERLRDSALFLVGLALGFRISELLSLKVADIRGALSDAPEAQIAVRRRTMKGKKKGRAVWANVAAREALRAYMAARESETGRAASDTDFVFASGGAGSKYSRPICRKWAWKLLSNTVRRAGIYDLTARGTHVMRKTFAQDIFVASGNNLHVAQQALGHANIQSTVKYLNSVDVDVKNLILNRRIA